MAKENNNKVLFLNFTRKSSIRMVGILVCFIIAATLLVTWNTKEGNCFYMLQNRSFDDISQSAYSCRDAEKCLSSRLDGPKNRLVLMGDSRLRIIYDALLRILMMPESIFELTRTSTKKDSRHFNRRYVDVLKNFQVDFIWMAKIDAAFVGNITLLQKESPPPSLLVVGGILHYMVRKNTSQEFNAVALEFENQLLHLTAVVEKLSPSFPIVWRQQELENGTFSFLKKRRELRKILRARNQPPDERAELRNKAKTIRQFKLRAKFMERINKMAHRILSASNHFGVWWNVATVGNSRLWDFYDTCHPNPATAAVYAQDLLQFFCSCS